MCSNFVGGIRCERASQYLDSLKDDCGTNAIDPPKNIYQLSGGIQRYLDYMSSKPDDSHFHGKNFVFDPRRTDPQSDNTIVGRCIVCDTKHDDYDNGHAPCEYKESRCYRCRVLVLVCDTCRPNICAWGDDVEGDVIPFLYCGGEKCVDEGNFLDSVQIL